MKKILIASVACFVAFIFLTSMIEGKAKSSATTILNKPVITNYGTDNSVLVNYWIDSLYTTLNLNKTGLSRNVFFTACKGYEFMLSQDKLIKQGLLTIC